MVEPAEIVPVLAAAEFDVCGVGVNVDQKDDKK